MDAAGGGGGGASGSGGIKNSELSIEQVGICSIGFSAAFMLHATLAASNLKRCLKREGSGKNTRVNFIFHSQFLSFRSCSNSSVSLALGGFRKIDPERWEFSNEEFIKDQKHLLKNIHRRKPIHSHSNPPTSALGSERTQYEDEIEKLTHDKAALEAKLLRTQQERVAVERHLADLQQRVNKMEDRQEHLLTFLDKAMQNPTFVEHLSRKIESMDFAAYSKKRRVPPHIDNSRSLTVADGFVDNHSSSSRAEFGNVFHQDFSSKLRLELSPAVSDINLISHSSTQSSNEDREKISEEDPKTAQIRNEGILFTPETLELTDTGNSLTFKIDSLAPANENRLFHKSSTSSEDVHLNLSLASSPLEILNKNPNPAKIPQLGQEVVKSPELRYDAMETDDLSKNKDQNSGDKSSSSEDARKNQGPVAPPIRVNDLFWEQFLTERPGASDNEEASSTYRANQHDEMSKSPKKVEQLTL
ncbi:hypothetical protein ACFE04_014676 [Oxalis oulophora]